MTFKIRNLSVLAYANGFTLWLYKANTIQDVMIPNYFNDAADMLTTGDIILVSSSKQGQATQIVVKSTDLNGIVVIGQPESLTPQE